MFKNLAILSTLAVANAAVSAPLTEENHQFLFTKWIQQHGKQYATEEFFAKFETFKANLAKIIEHNNSGASYTMEMNEYGDMTADEFKAQYMGFAGSRNSFLRSMNTPDEDEPIPAVLADSALDWRKKGAVTPVKNQGQCGSCWAFSTTGSLEGAHYLKHNKLVSFSEQQLVDCSSAEGNNGCNGGLMDNGFEYIIKKGGLCTEKDYPYTASTDSCNVCDAPVKGLIKSYKDVSQGDEKALMVALGHGPVSIAIEADQSAFQFYSGGVMDGNCGDQLDHGVLLVGYGTDSGKDYWIVKNSWGAQWGEEGYIRIIRGENKCGLANSASYPIAK